MPQGKGRGLQFPQGLQRLTIGQRRQRNKGNASTVHTQGAVVLDRNMSVKHVKFRYVLISALSSTTRVVIE